MIKAFEDDFLDISPDSFVFTKEVHRFSELLGSTVSSQNAPSQITIIGPQRCGKSSAIKMIMNELNSNIEQNYALYRAYDDTFWSWWEETNFNSTQIFFFDDIYPIWTHLTAQSYKDLLDRSKYDRIIIVTVLNPIERYWLQQSKETNQITVFNAEPFEFRYKRSMISEIENMIQKRAEAIGKTEVLSSKVLKTISILSMGLPGLALWITRHLISQKERQENWKNITIPSVYRTVEYLGFNPALRLIAEHNAQYAQQADVNLQTMIWPVVQPLKEIFNDDSNSLIQSLSEVKPLTTSWRPILEEMLILNHHTGSIKRSELQERTGVKESSLTYQCQKLIKEKIVTYNKDGREVNYHLGSPVKEALELTFFG